MLRRAITAALVLAALAPATAWAAWFPVSEYPDDTFPGVQVGIDDGEHAVFGWVVRRDGEPFTVRHKRKVSPTGFLAASTAAGSDNLPVDVAVASGGGTTISWVRHAGGQVRLTAKRGRTTEIHLGDPYLISPTGTDVIDWRAEYLDDATVLLVWTGADGTIAMRRWSATAPSPIVKVAEAGSPEGLDLATDGHGGFLIGWTALEDGDRRAYVADGVTTRPVASPGRDVTDVAVDLDGARRALIAWDEHNASGHRLLVRHRSAAGSLGSIMALDGNQPEPLDPKLALGEGGTGVLAWRGAAGARALRAVTVSTTAAPGPRISVTNPGVSAHAAGVGDDGRAVFVWESSDERIISRRLPSGGALGPRRVLSEAGVPAFAPDVSVNAAGGAIAVWSTLPGARTRAAGAVVP